MIDIMGGIIHVAGVVYRRIAGGCGYDRWLPGLRSGALLLFESDTLALFADGLLALPNPGEPDRILIDLIL